MKWDFTMTQHIFLTGKKHIGKSTLILSTVLWCFPMFPNAHTKSVPDITVKFFAECFHTSYLEVVNPPSDKLIELFHLVAVANAPTTASEFSHSVLKLRY